LAQLTKGEECVTDLAPPHAMSLMTINKEVQKPDDATLILKRMLNASQELAFRAWTSAEHIQQWMRPEPAPL
jgi:hypothetical protein